MTTQKWEIEAGLKHMAEEAENPTPVPIQLCEEPRWDSTVSTRCEHVGFSACVLHTQPVHENIDGWRVCCEKCKTPFHIVTEEE